MEQSPFVWRFPDLLPFLLIGAVSIALPFIPFLNQPGIVLAAYLALCALALISLIRFPEDNRPDAEPTITGTKTTGDAS